MLSDRATDTWLAPDACSRARSRRDDSLDAVIARIALGQGGVVARWQLIAAGVHAEAIDRRLASGALHVVHPGVYAVGQRELAPLARVWADLLRCGPDARAGGFTSASMLGAVPLLHRARTTIVVPADDKPAPPGVRVRRLVVPAVERTTVRGVPCLSPARTVLDVAAIHGAGAAERVWRGLVHHGRLDLDEVSAMLEHHEGERGIVAVRALYDRRVEIVGASESGLENRVARLAVLAGLPEPHRNVRVVLSSGRAVRFDLCLRDRMLAIEADGPYHDDPEVKAEDALRDAAAAADGWRTERVHHSKRDDEVIAQLRSAHTAVSVDLPGGYAG